MALISRKKPPVPIPPRFLDYLRRYDRHVELPIRYLDLGRYEQKTALYDSQGRDTLWSTLLYSQTDTDDLHEALRRAYATLKASGDERVMRHLFVERIDLCEYGNTFPYRVKIVNRFNENFDYFYLKRVDASRLLGLELEHLTAPSRINYLVDADTLIEEHIPGIPGEVFITDHLGSTYVNEIRLAKEFIKFNERCLVRLLGDMHKNNFVIEVTPDFDQTFYRIRAIDFDQQCYEGNLRVYQPQYHTENNPIIQLGMGRMTQETVVQYQNEERASMRYRIHSQKRQMEDLLQAILLAPLAPEEHLAQLRQSLAQHYEDPAFETARTMGMVLKRSLQTLFA
ncbi:MAG: hypothetical protein SFY70_07400 [Bacteroidia bacterium]|nr:hypothetical protein [Bacteroidia bacterium]